MEERERAWCQALDSFSLSHISHITHHLMKLKHQHDLYKLENQEASFQTKTWSWHIWLSTMEHSLLALSRHVTSWSVAHSSIMKISHKAIKVKREEGCSFKITQEWVFQHLTVEWVSLWEPWLSWGLRYYLLRVAMIPYWYQLPARWIHFNYQPSNANRQYPWHYVFHKRNLLHM